LEVFIQALHKILGGLRDDIFRLAIPLIHVGIEQFSKLDIDALCEKARHDALFRIRLLSCTYENFPGKCYPLHLAYLLHLHHENWAVLDLFWCGNSSVSRCLICSFCSSDRVFASDFLLSPPRGGYLNVQFPPIMYRLKRMLAQGGLCPPWASVFS